MHAKHTYMYGMHTGSDVCHMCLVWFAVRRLCLSRRVVLCAPAQLLVFMYVWISVVV